MKLVGNGSYTNPLDGTQTWNINNPNPATFPALTSASAQLQDACCPTDIPSSLVMYFTAGTEVQPILTYTFTQMNPDQFTTGRSYVLDYGYQDLESLVEQSDGTGAPRTLFDAPFDIGSDSGSYAGRIYQDQSTKSHEFFCGDSNGFEFDQTFTTTLPPSVQIQENGSYSRSTQLAVFHLDTITSIECVDGPPTNCEDGTIDVP